MYRGLARDYSVIETPPATTMINKDLAHRRMHNQQLIGSAFSKPEEIVAWFGAVQAQDYLAAKWALGLRLPHLLDDAIEQAFNAGLILRTHVMRPTWHFVAPADLRWLLELTGPRVQAANKFMYRQRELDAASLARGRKAISKALHDGNHLTRAEIARRCLQTVNEATGLRFLHVMMDAELSGLICSGAKRGKEHTYALLDERAPGARRLPRDEALATLAIRYFKSHGPATVKDFVWWSGLTTTDARAGLALAKISLLQEEIAGEIYWFAEQAQPAKPSARVAYLLPNYDEYIVGYADRSAIFDGPYEPLVDARGNVLFQHTIMMDGLIIGTWRRTLARKGVMLTTRFAAPPSAHSITRVRRRRQALRRVPRTARATWLSGSRALCRLPS